MILARRVVAQPILMLIAVLAILVGAAPTPAAPISMPSSIRHGWAPAVHAPATGTATRAVSTSTTTPTVFSLPRLPSGADRAPLPPAPPVQSGASVAVLGHSVAAEGAAWLLARVGLGGARAVVAVDALDVGSEALAAEDAGQRSTRKPLWGASSIGGRGPLLR